MFNWFKKKVCSHRFVLDDLKQTGIPLVEPVKPAKDGTYQEWLEYFSTYYDKLQASEGYSKRVVWPCAKCGKKFYAHCGLDIAHDGTIIRREEVNGKA